MHFSPILQQLIQALPALKEHHAPTSLPYQFLSKVARSEVERLFSDTTTEKKSFGPFGSLAFPYFKMGAIDSLDLFGIDELILFSFYWINRNRYKKVLDIGANIGLHTTIMSRCGFEVQLFEPDPSHFSQLQNVMALNEIQKIKAHQAAVSSRSGEAEFVRVLGNTTSSHLAGSKQPHGELEQFVVPLFNIKDIIAGVDLIKMDVEGHENTILLSTTFDDWKNTDALVEIGSPDKAQHIFNHLQQKQVKAFSQKNNWEKVQALEDMPMSYKEGSLFISNKEEMPWD